MRAIIVHTSQTTLVFHLVYLAKPCATPGCESSYHMDTVTLTAENSETVCCFGVPVLRKVTAELRPVNTR
jgi:hypothetical protein